METQTRKPGGGSDEPPNENKDETDKVQRQKTEPVKADEAQKQNAKPEKTDEQQREETELGATYEPQEQDIKPGKTDEVHGQETESVATYEPQEQDIKPGKTDEVHGQETESVATYESQAQDTKPGKTDEVQGQETESVATYEPQEQDIKPGKTDEVQGQETESVATDESQEQDTKPDKTDEVQRQERESVATYESQAQDTKPDKTGEVQRQETESVATSESQEQDTKPEKTDEVQRQETESVATDESQEQDTKPEKTDEVQRQATESVATDESQEQGTKPEKTNEVQRQETESVATDESQEQDTKPGKADEVHGQETESGATYESQEQDTKPGKTDEVQRKERESVATDESQEQDTKPEKTDEVQRQETESVATDESQVQGTKPGKTDEVQTQSPALAHNQLQLQQSQATVASVKNEEDGEEYHDCPSDFAEHNTQIPVTSANQQIQNTSEMSGSSLRVSQEVEASNLEDFKAECRRQNLNPETIKMLIKEGYDSNDALAALIPEDLNELKDKYGISMGQLSLLRQYVKELTDQKSVIWGQSRGQSQTSSEVEPAEVQNTEDDENEDQEAEIPVFEPDTAATADKDKYDDTNQLTDYTSSQEKNEDTGSNTQLGDQPRSEVEETTTPMEPNTAGRVPLSDSDRGKHGDIMAKTSAGDTSINLPPKDELNRANDGESHTVPTGKDHSDAIPENVKRDESRPIGSQKTTGDSDGQNDPQVLNKPENDSKTNEMLQPRPPFEFRIAVLLAYHSTWGVHSVTLGNLIPDILFKVDGGLLVENVSAMNIKYIDHRQVHANKNDHKYEVVLSANAYSICNAFLDNLTSLEAALKEGIKKHWKEATPGLALSVINIVVNISTPATLLKNCKDHFSKRSPYLEGENSRKESMQLTFLLALPAEKNIKNIRLRLKPAKQYFHCNETDVSNQLWYTNLPSMDSSKDATKYKFAVETQSAEKYETETSELKKSSNVQLSVDYHGNKTTEKRTDALTLFYSFFLKQAGLDNSLTLTELLTRCELVQEKLQFHGPQDSTSSKMVLNWLEKLNASTSNHPEGPCLVQFLIIEEMGLITEAVKMFGKSWLQTLMDRVFAVNPQELTPAALKVYQHLNPELYFQHLSRQTYFHHVHYFYPLVPLNNWKEPKNFSPASTDVLDEQVMKNALKKACAPTEFCKDTERKFVIRALIDTWPLQQDQHYLGAIIEVKSILDSANLRIDDQREIISALSNKINLWLNNFLTDLGATTIFDLFDSLVNSNLLTKDIGTTFLASAVHKLERDPVEEDIVCLFRRLHHGSDPKQLLKIIIQLFEKQSQAYHNLAIEILKGIRLDEIPDRGYTTVKIARCWFSTVENTFRAQPAKPKDLLIFFRTYVEITTVLKEEKVKRSLMKRLIDILSGKKLFLIKLFSDMCKESEDIQELYIQCLWTIFTEKGQDFDQDDIIRAVVEMVETHDHPPKNESRFAAKWYQFLLTLMKLPEEPCDVNAVITVLKNIRFWCNMLLCEGAKATEIKNNPAAIKVKEAMKYLYDNASSMDIDVQFCRRVAKVLDDQTKPMLAKLIVQLLKGPKYQIDASDVEAVFQMIFINTQVMDANLAAVESIIMYFLPKIVGNIKVTDLAEAKKTVSDLKKEIGDTKRQISLKGAMQSVRTPATNYIFCEPDAHELDELTKSIVFQRICCNVLNSDTTSSKDIMSIVKLANTTARDKFKSLFADGSEEIQLTDAVRWVDGISIANELEIASKIMKPTITAHLLEFLSHWKERHQCLVCLRDLIKQVRIDTSACKEYDQFHHALLNAEAENKLEGFKHGYESMIKMARIVAPEDWDVISKLESAWDMFVFIKEKKNDDFRFLIDAVVDAEQQVNPKIVRYFDRLHQFIKAIVDEEYGKNIQKFLEKLHQENKQSGNELAVMLDDCWGQYHNLKLLYNTVTNKDEITRAVVEKTVSRGIFSFKMNNDGQCSFHVAYQKEEIGKKKNIEIVTYQQPQMVEYRSRVFLLQSSSDGKGISNQENEILTNEHYKIFVKYISAAVDICKLCEKLHRSGCFSYRQFEWEGKMSGLTSHGMLEKKQEQLEKDLEKWSNVLETARKEFHYLNYVYSDQLWTLYDFFSKGRPNSKLGDIFKFINPQLDIPIDKIWRNHKISSGNIDWMDKIRALGKHLQSIFTSHPYSPEQGRPFPNLAEPGIPIEGVQDTPAVVNNGDFLVVPLPKDSSYVVQTILKLYEQTTGYYPEPFQIMMCSPDTSKEEVTLFLRRCCQSSSIQQDDCLFCIANIELLPHEVLFSLVKYLQGISAAEMTKQVHHRLVVICRGDPQQSLLVQFATKCRSIGVLPSPIMESYLSDLHPHIQVVKSDVPGLGKTNYIHKMAFDNGRKIQTVFVSSKFEKSKFIQELGAKRLKERDILHIDISNVSNPTFLDDELFEFLVTGMLSSGTMLYHLPTKHVMIEIANAQLEVKNKIEILINALPFTSCFPKRTLQWESFSNFVVSKCLSSPVQTVCHYFKAFDEGLLNTTDVVPTQPVDPQKCKELLQKYVQNSLVKKGLLPTDMSFNIAQSFLFMLAVQLKRMSCSVYFQTSVLKMTGNEQSDLKSELFKALIGVVADFAVRSVKPSSDLQKTSQALITDEGRTAEDVSYTISVDKRFDGMIHWSDSNHLMVLFHDQDPDTISPIYHDIKDVPDGIKDLFNNLNEPLPDFSSQSPQDLLRLLKRLVYDSPLPYDEERFAKMLESYALTADNFQKMVLIKWKVNAGIPVVIMGDTGCGKTSLIQFLADLCGIDCSVYGFHAGITETNIMEKITLYNNKALKELDKQFWVLLDEINTCDFLGLLNEIICSHTIKGGPLTPNLVFMAACNPYCIRKNVFTSGLEDKKVFDARSPLVYRVHPLPEGMIDYVWDFGFLSPLDEQKYIEKMMTNTLISIDLRVKTDVLCKAQDFLRNVEGSKWCVSLRDVRRCQYLMGWFQRMYDDRRKADPNEVLGNPDLNSLLLAVSHCYTSRLGQRQERNLFENELRKMIQGRVTGNFTNLIRTEQLRILNCMDLQKGIAKNEALRENVFVMFVCIMARLPLFVVGKPGSSKSLSMQILINSLRGSRSRNPYLRNLPKLYVVSCQGSESLVSTDISKRFQKAVEYNEQNKKASKEDKVTPVVLLDEVGLAECSPHNPLKVLHELLEPARSEFPEVAVVGISNWALDASKMNRAVHLSRPDLDEEGLFETGRTIAEDLQSDQDKLSPDFEKVIESVAHAYFEYSKKQKERTQSKRHFHGLRDFYSLVKYLCRPLKELQDRSKLMKPMRILKGILRNFGGSTTLFDRTEMLRCFIKHLKEHLPDIANCSAHSLDLIEENLSDNQSRHMLLLSSGDSALSVIQNKLNQLNRSFKVVFGSKFKEDQNSEDYHCRKLSEIILCMEQGTVVILKDLDNIYGSLYDMLNQNYGTFGEKQICRVARGAFSNPTCEVHRDFKCIVLVDIAKINQTDPPFLNRFEKQVLNIMELLNDEENQLTLELNNWISKNASVADYGDNKNAFIINYHKELIPSILLRDRLRDVVNPDKKEELLRLALPDAIMRLSKSAATEDFRETQNDYFKLPIQDGLKGLIQNVESISAYPKSTHPIKGSRIGELGFRLIVFTHSNIYTDISECFGNASRCQVERLAEIKAEKELYSILQNFMADDTKAMFFLQCRISSDAPHVILARSLIENISQDKVKGKTRKNFCIVVHVDHKVNGNQAESQFSLFNYLSGWQLVTLESLEKHEYSLPELSKMSVVEAVKRGFCNLSSVIKDQMLQAFLSVRYTGAGRPPKDLSQLIQDILNCPELMAAFKDSILNEMQKKPGNVMKSTMADTNNWVVDIACNSVLIAESQTLFDCIRYFIRSKAKGILNAIIFNIEKRHAWVCVKLPPTYTKQVWMHLFHDSSVFSITEEQTANVPGDTFIISGKPIDLKFPFSHVFLSKLQQIQNAFTADPDIKELTNCEGSISDETEVADHIWKELAKKYEHTFDTCLESLRNKNYLERHLQDLIDDICLIYTASLPVSIPRDCRLRIIKRLIGVEKLGDFKTVPPLWSRSASVCLEFLFRLWHSLTMVFDTLHMLDACIHVGQKELIRVLLREDEADNPSLTSKHQAGTATSKSREYNGLFTEKLVNAVCTNFMPTKQLLDKCKGIINWQNQAGKILSVASRVGWSVPALHMLRVCNDFASIFMRTHDPKQELLARLGEKAVADMELGLNNLGLYGHIEDLLKILEESSTQESIHIFRCLYFGRCLDVEEHMQMLVPLLQYTLHDNFQVKSFGPVLYRCFKPFDAILCDLTNIVNNDNYFDDCPTLHAIDAHLLKVKLCEDNSPGLKFAVLCCDFVEYAVMQGDCMDLNPDQLMRIPPDENSLMVLTKIADVMYNAEECSLKLICCIAFARGFLRAVARALSRNRADISNEGANKVVQYTSRLLYTNEGSFQERGHSTVGFILRAIYDASDFEHLQNICNTYLRQEIAAIEQIEWSDDPGWNIIGFNPFARQSPDSESEACKAWESLVGRDTSLMKKYLEYLNTEKKEELLSILMVKMYLRRLQNPPTEDVKDAAAILDKLLKDNKNLPDSYRHVANCLSGHVSYEELEPVKTELRSRVLILHILSVAVSQDGFLNSLTSNPIKREWIFERMSAALENKPNPTGAISHAKCNRCSCYTVSKKKWNECPRCHSSSGDVTTIQIQQVDSIDSCELGNEFTTGYFSPRAWRATRAILNSCIFGASVTNICSMANRKPDLVKNDNEMLMKDFKHDIDALKSLLNTQDRTVFSFLHKVVCLLKTVGGKVLASSEAFGRLEKELTSVIESWNCKDIELYNKSFPLLDLVMELESPTGSFHHFLRLTPTRAFDGVVSEMRQGRHLENHHFQILRLIIQHRRQIELLKFLPPLINWTMTITKELGHRKNKVDCSTKAVEDIVKSPALRRNLKEFRCAWKELIKLKPVIAKMNPALAKEMERIDLTQHFDQYVMDKEDSALYMMIQFLVRLQNSLINQVMEIAMATGEANTVPYMYHSPETMIVPLVPVEDLTEKDVIGCEGAFEKVLFLMESDPRYGHGMQGSYDLDKVEFTLARDLFSGKCFLYSEGRLPLFMYEEELFFSCETLLFDIHASIKQSLIDESIRNGLDRDLDADPFRDREMLTNLGVVLSMLKKTSGSPRELLVTYVEKWMKSAIDTFPIDLLSSTKESIALCHIGELYEYYELHYASTTIDNLPGDIFCTNKGDDMIESLYDCFPKLQQKGIKQEHLINAVKRYVVRYIRPKISSLTPSQLETPLQEVLLTKRTLWPRKPFHEEGFDWGELGGIIPRTILVRQIREVVKYSEKFLEASNERANLIAPWMAKPVDVKKRKPRVDM